MRRTRICFDNAPVESFCGKRQTVMVKHRWFATKLLVRRADFESIEKFHAHKRLHATLAHVCPGQFELSLNR